MSKIYMVTEQDFFKSNNIDYAMAVDFANDVKLFTNKKKAIEYMTERYSFYHENFDCYIEAGENFNIVHKNNGTRVVIAMYEHKTL